MEVKIHPKLNSEEPIVTINMSLSQAEDLFYLLESDELVLCDLLYRKLGAALDV